MVKNHILWGRARMHYDYNVMLISASYEKLRVSPSHTVL
jgi:hypothetical protein